MCPPSFCFVSLPCRLAGGVAAIAFLVGDPSAPRPSAAALGAHLSENGIAKWWLPDEFIFLEALPKTGVGKFDKKLMREKMDEYLAKAC